MRFFALRLQNDFLFCDIFVYVVFFAYLCSRKAAMGVERGVDAPMALQDGSGALWDMGDGQWAPDLSNDLKDIKDFKDLNDGAKRRIALLNKKCK